ncbi:hypothetical protein LTR05_004112 [Lithohypha guttulata]|uniref:NmrA-like domain-containing protein n=1 Tax=Lithohypha guttulata TaxID=1690604 RepID=A0AAN7YHD6_9EURO|nr:hypothetical protein LTR05_004112 [Lithohypha guttulata]
MAKHLLTVFGATGNQGGGVIKTFLGNPTLSSQFSLRAITRNTSSDKAKALASQGVDLAVGDLNDLESLKEAIKGSYAVFAVTNYWETMSSPKEIQQGKNIADACIATSVKHVVWSALPNVTELTGGKLKAVEHFDGKSEVARYMDSIKKQTGMITTFFMPAFYASNFKTMTRSSPYVNDGVPTLTLPWDLEKTQVPIFNPSKDGGPFVAGIVSYPDPAELDGKWIQAVGEWKTPAEIVAEMSEVIGREIKFNSVPEDVYQGFLPENIAKELTENMVLVRDYSYYGVGTEKQQAESNKVLEPLGFTAGTFKEYVKEDGPWEF